MSESQTRPSAAIFGEIADEILSRFVYVSDQKQYGKLEHWDELREVGGKLAGDCEDAAVTIANRAHEAGVPLGDMTIHLVQVERSPDHIVISCGDLVADCNTGVRPRRSRWYFRWISERNLGQSEWRRS